MSAIDQFFRERGLDVDEARVVDALATLLGGRLGATGSVSLPAADSALLADHGGVADRPGAEAVEAAAATTAAVATALVADALTVAEVAERAGVSTSRVRHWVADGAVQAIRVGGRNLLPSWQFGPDGRALPHLGEVLAALPDDLHPVSVAGFFSTPQPELTLDDRRVAPATWLLAGGLADPVLALAEGLAVAA